MVDNGQVMARPLRMVVQVVHCTRVPGWEGKLDQNWISILLAKPCALVPICVRWDSWKVPFPNLLKGGYLLTQSCAYRAASINLYGNSTYMYILAEVLLIRLRQGEAGSELTGRFRADPFSAASVPHRADTQRPVHLGPSGWHFQLETTLSLGALSSLTLWFATQNINGGWDSRSAHKSLLA